MIQLNKRMYYLQHTIQFSKHAFFNLICFSDTSFALFVSNNNNLCISQDTLVFPSDSHCVMKPSGDRNAPSEPLRVCSHSEIPILSGDRNTLSEPLRVCPDCAMAKAKSYGLFTLSDFSTAWR